MTRDWILFNGELISLSATIIKRIAPDGQGNIVFYYPNNTSKSYAFGSVDAAAAKMPVIADAVGAQDTTLPSISSVSPSTGTSLGSITLILTGINLTVPTGGVLNGIGGSDGASSATCPSPNLATITFTSISGFTGLFDLTVTIGGNTLFLPGVLTLN